MNLFRYCESCGFSSIWVELSEDLHQCGHCLRKKKTPPKYEDPTEPPTKESEFQREIDDMFTNSK